MHPIASLVKIILILYFEFSIVRDIKYKSDFRRLELKLFNARTVFILKLIANNVYLINFHKKAETNCSELTVFIEAKEQESSGIYDNASEYAIS